MAFCWTAVNETLEFALKMAHANSFLSDNVIEHFTKATLPLRLDMLGERPRPSSPVHVMCAMLTRASGPSPSGRKQLEILRQRLSHGAP